MKKAQRKHLEQIGTTGKYRVSEPPQAPVTERTSNAKKHQKKRVDPEIYEEGDLRRIVAEGHHRSIDPYSALLEAGVIKRADEFFEDGDW